MLHFVAVPKKGLVGEIQCRIKTGQIINKDAISLRRSARYFSRSEHSKCVLIVEYFLAGAAMGRKRFLLAVLVLVEATLSLMEDAGAKAKTTSGLASKQNIFVFTFCILFSNSYKYSPFCVNIL
jgi:hypothetical protein